jgi:hypothetical protein
MNKPVIVTTFAIALLLVGAHAMAHELQDNRATLVLRDRTHVSVTLFLSYPEALHQALAPQRPFMAFLLVYSAMKPEELQKELLRAQVRFQSTTHLWIAPARDLPLSNWIWPDLKQVQAILQQRVMQAMVDPNGHSHEAPVEVHADANAAQEITSVQVQFPEEFQKVLVVAFRPSQLWVESKSLSAAIKF